MSKKALILGGSHSDLPLIESCLLSGLEVITTGNRPDHPGHWHAHKYVPADFADCHTMLALAKSENVAAVLPGANDFALISASYVCESLGLPGYDAYETTLLLHLKDRFKKLASDLGLPICQYRTVVETKLSHGAFNTDLKYPIIVKPINLTGGKGMTRVNAPAELSSAMSYAFGVSQQSSLVLEEWFDGTLHSYSTYVQDGRVVFEYFDTEVCAYQDFLVSTSMSTCNLSNGAKRSLKEATQAVVDKLSLVDGVLHCQFLSDGQQIRILEYTRRMSGDLYSRVVQLVRGFRHNDLFLYPALGIRAPALWDTASKGVPWVSRHCITSDQSGYFNGIAVDNSIRPFILSLTSHLQVGTQITGDGRSKVATVIMSFPTLLAMQETITTIKESCRVDVCANKLFSKLRP
jgi:biotin carboxylase